MEKIYRDYPDDLDAAAFYLFLLLGLVRASDKVIAYMPGAGAMALDVYQKNPNHPGAAHYIIHAFDDPGNARSSPCPRRALRQHRARSASRAAHAVAHFSTTRYVARGCGIE